MGSGQVNVPQCPLPCRESRRDGVAGSSKIGANDGQQCSVISALLRVRWVLPINFDMLAGEVRRERLVLTVDSVQIVSTAQL